MAISKLEEAELLSNGGYNEGGFYLAGYAVELALKAKVCEHLDIPNLFYDSPFLKDLNLKTHNFNVLLLLTGKRNKFETALSKDVSLTKNWNIILTSWTPECRYNHCKSIKKSAVSSLINAIGNKNNGILTWILNN